MSPFPQKLVKFKFLQVKTGWLNKCSKLLSYSVHGEVWKCDGDGLDSRAVTTVWGGGRVELIVI